TSSGPWARSPKRALIVEVLFASRNSVTGAAGLKSDMPLSSTTPGATAPSSAAAPTFGAGPPNRTAGGPAAVRGAFAAAGAGAGARGAGAGGFGAGSGFL